MGELLMRMSPSLNGTWLREAQMPVYLGGAELNVATALAKWDLPVGYFTALPDNYLSDEILEMVQQKGIDVSPVLRVAGRIGIYYLPQGADLKHAGVIYDRVNSSFASLRPGIIDWDNLLHDVSCLHLSAISPAVSESAAQVCLEAMKIAAEKGIIISIDLNYRSKLWQYGKEPGEIMPELMQYCTIVMGNIWSAQELLNIPVDPTIHAAADSSRYVEHAHQTAKQIMRNYPACRLVANTFRFDEGEGIKYFATLDTAKGQFISAAYATPRVVDKIGTGDCFMAGLLYGLYHGHELEEVINFSAAAAFGKLQEKSDATNQSIASVNKIVEAYGRGKSN